MRRGLFHMRKTRLLLLAGALFALCAAPAFAQSDNETGQLMGRISQLENQVQTLSRAVFRGDKDAAAAAALSANAAGGAGIAAFDARLSQIEDKQRTLTGQIEKIGYDVQQLKDQLARMQADTDQRFQQLGANSGGAPAASSPVPPAAQPASTVKTLGTLDSDGHNGPPEQLYEASFASIKAGKYDDAAAGFKQFLSQYPGHPLASNAQYWLGETYYVRGNYKDAARTFAQNYQDYPKGPKAGDSLLKLGLSLAMMGKKDDACLSLRQLQKEEKDDSSPLMQKAGEEVRQLGCP